jgi:thioesterase domain-containing protein/acyl carrier protein
MNEHRGVVNRLVWMQSAYGLTSRDAVLQKTPFSFDVSVWEFFWPLLTGAKLVVARPESHKDPGYLEEVIRESGITTMHFVPSMLRIFLEHEKASSCSSLSRVVSSGEALPLWLAKRFHECLPQAALHNLYGPTEAAIDVTAWTSRRDYEGSSAPIGRPIANTEIYVLDGQMQPVPVGVTGELYIGGAGVARGYLNRPELTAERFVSDPFARAKAGAAPARMYRTGDLGRWLPDGNIEFQGRNDSQVKVRGYRIELGEVESRLREVSGVQAAVVLAREDEPGDKRLVGYYTGSEQVGAERLRSELAGKLPGYMVPVAFVRLESMPLTPNGKLDRKALPAPESEAYGRQGYRKPQGEVEQSLAEIWSELLKVERVGRDDDFFELGGHSLLAVTLVSRIRSVLGVELPLALLFTASTLQALGRHLAKNADPNSWSPIVALQKNGTTPPFFCVPGAGGNARSFVQLASELGDSRPFYGLQALGLQVGTKPLHTVEQLAAFFIDEIRAVQPKGPYLLGGWSFGGLVAFEMARQLSRDGQPVDFVALLDTRAPPCRPEQRKDLPSEIRQFVNFVKLRGGDISYEEMLSLPAKYHFERGLAALVEAGVFPPEFSVSEFHHLWETTRAQERAVWLYAPEVYSGKLSIFRASEQYTWEPAEARPNLGWDEYSSQSVDLSDVPGNHQSMLAAPHVGALAEDIRRRLRAVAP